MPAKDDATSSSPPTLSLPAYLAQRNGVFYFKRKIPAPLRSALGNRGQVWKTLETSNLREASGRLAEELKAFSLRIETFQRNLEASESASAQMQLKKRST